MAKVPHGAVDASLEQPCVAQQERLPLDVRLVRAAGQVQGHSTGVQVLQKGGCAFEGEVLLRKLAPFEPGQPLLDPDHELPVVERLVAVLVEHILSRHVAELPDHLDQTLHLGQGLDSGGPLDVVANLLDHAPVDGFVDVPFVGAQDRAHHHRFHDLFPSLPQGRDRAVVVEDGTGRPQAPGNRCDDLDVRVAVKAGPLGKRCQFGVVTITVLHAESEDLLR